MKSLKSKAGSLALAVGAYAVLRVVGVIDAPESWSTYAPPDAGYSILTPGSMRESTETIPTMNGDIVFEDASIDFVGVHYQVGYAPHSSACFKTRARTS